MDFRDTIDQGPVNNRNSFLSSGSCEVQGPDESRLSIESQHSALTHCLSEVT